MARGASGLHFPGVADYADSQGVVPAGFGVAVALGVAAGTLTRKVLPAMAVTVFAFVGVRLAVALFARPRFLPPLELTEPVIGGHDPSRSGDWIVGTSLYDAAGEQLPGGPSFRTQTVDTCVDQFSSARLHDGAYNVFEYQPVGRFGRFS